MIPDTLQLTEIQRGALNASIHQIDENIACTDPENLSNIYRSILDVVDAEPVA